LAELEKLAREAFSPLMDQAAVGDPAGDGASKVGMPLMDDDYPERVASEVGVPDTGIWYGAPAPGDRARTPWSDVVDDPGAQFVASAEPVSHGSLANLVRECAATGVGDFRRLPSAAWDALHAAFGSGTATLKGKLLHRLTCPGKAVADEGADSAALPNSDVGVTRSGGQEELAALEREQRAVRKALKFLKGASSDLSKVYERAYEVRKRIRELRGE